MAQRHILYERRRFNEYPLEEGDHVDKCPHIDSLFTNIKPCFEEVSSPFAQLRDGLGRHAVRKITFNRKDDQCNPDNAETDQV